MNLAKNAGTSIEQIERFYARNLLLAKETVRNLGSVLICTFVKCIEPIQ